MTQTANRRLLTEAAGAAAYRTAAQVDTQADARVAAMLTVQKGQPSGLASLDATGKVPAAQIPVQVGQAVYAVKLADTARANTVTKTGDPDLFLPLSAGMYLLEQLVYAWHPNTAAARPQFSATVSAGTYTQYGAILLNVYSSPAVLSHYSAAPWPTAAFNGNGTDANTGAMLMTTMARFSAAATFTLTWAQATSNATPAVVGAGSWMRATKIAA